MSETIQTKLCNDCNTIKPISDFNIRKASLDGHSHHCRSCHNRYNRKYNNSERGKRKNAERYRNYVWPDSYIQWRKEYYGSDHGKNIRNKNSRITRQKYPHKARARSAVNHAIRDGKLPPASRYHCRMCWTQAEEYHHHRGYELEHWLDVIPVCVKCHCAIHKSTESS